jgi:predicted DNA-binding transcriptional regulator YafY
MNWYKIAQTTYDPDNPDEPLRLEDIEPLDMEDDNLPVLTPEDIEPTIEDGMQEEQTEEPVAPEKPEIPEKEYPEFPSAFQATDWAKKKKEVVRIAYKLDSGPVIVRDVEPHGKYHARTTGRDILVTFDRTIGDIRSFIISNIQDYQFTGEAFQPRFRFSAAAARRKRKQHKIPKLLA